MRFHQNMDVVNIMVSLRQGNVVALADPGEHLEYFRSNEIIYHPAPVFHANNEVVIQIEH